MKITIALMIGIGCFVKAIAQDDCLWDVVSTAGSSQEFETEGVFFSWTIGETVIATLEDDNVENVLLTQGFQQPRYALVGCITVSTTEMEFPDFELEIFPNPVIMELHITGTKVIPWNAGIAVFNVLGQKVFELNMPAGEKQVLLDVSTLTAGIYFIKVEIPFVKRIKTYKIIKI